MATRCTRVFLPRLHSRIVKTTLGWDPTATTTTPTTPPSIGGVTTTGMATMRSWVCLARPPRARLLSGRTLRAASRPRRTHSARLVADTTALMTTPTLRAADDRDGPEFLGPTEEEDRGSVVRAHHKGEAQ